MIPACAWLVSGFCKFNYLEISHFQRLVSSKRKLLYFFWEREINITYCLNEDCHKTNLFGCYKYKPLFYS